jgi:hypothetical protein
MNALLLRAFKYLLNRVIEPASIGGYLMLAFTWLSAHGVILTQFQQDSVTAWVLQTVALILVLLPDKILKYVPSKILNLAKKK